MKQQALTIILEDYIKILSIDLDTRSFEVHKVPQGECISYTNIDEYWDAFYNSDIIHSEDKEKVKNFIAIANVGKSVIYRRMINNEYHYVVMELKDRDNKYYLLIKDIDNTYNTELPLVVNKAQRVDTMTGLLNHKAYEEDVKKLPKGNVGIAFVDINGLKWTNDHRGHAEGDNLIIKVSTMLQNQFPAYSIYRIGGDEFVVIGFNIKVRTFIHMVATLHKRIWNDKSTFAIGETRKGKVRRFPIVSMGYSSDVAEDIQEIIEDAEKQMYEDKSIFHRKYPQYSRRSI